MDESEVIWDFELFTDDGDICTSKDCLTVNFEEFGDGERVQAEIG